MVMFPFGGGLNGDDFYPNDEEEFNGPCYESYNSSYYKHNFKIDKWYYHKKVDIKLIFSTDKAYLVQDCNGKYWIPKKLLYLREGKKARQYTKFEVKYLKDEDE